MRDFLEGVLLLLRRNRGMRVRMTQRDHATERYCFFSLPSVP